MDYSIVEELVDLELLKRELKENIRVDLFFKLVKKYNTFYADNYYCEEAINLERLIDIFKSFDEVKYYYYVVNKINEILENITFYKDGEDYKIFDDSCYKGLLIKHK